jgi:hypothetical protein
MSIQSLIKSNIDQLEVVVSTHLASELARVELAFKSFITSELDGWLETHKQSVSTTVRREADQQNPT